MRIPYSPDSPFAVPGNGSRLLTQDLTLGAPGGLKPTMPGTEEEEQPQTSKLAEQAEQNPFPLPAERKP